MAEVFAPLLVVGDVIRVNDPHAHGVVRVLGVAGERVTLELQLAGLANPADAVVAALERLGRTAGTPLTSERGVRAGDPLPTFTARDRQQRATGKPVLAIGEVTMWVRPQAGD